MDVLKAIEKRHSVRSYVDKELATAVVEALNEEIEACSREGGINVRLVANEKKTFGGLMARLGKFRGVRNYLVLTGDGSEETEEKLGYYGERIVLKAQALGLNSCWVAATYSKGACRKACGLEKEEKLACAIALGYGETQGVPHEGKPLTELFELCAAAGKAPEWFVKGVEAAALAPTALNRQNFNIVLLEDGRVRLEKQGACAALDLGIVRYHFEQGAGKENFEWA